MTSPFKYILLVIPTLILVPFIVVSMNNKSEPNELPKDKKFSDEIACYGKIRKLLQDNYIEEVDTSALFESAMKGMLKDLEYSKIEDRNQFDFEVNGEYFGIGAYCSRSKTQPDKVLVNKIMYNSPASKRFKLGDEIIEVSGRPVAGLSINEVHELMRGDEKPDSECEIKWIDVDSGKQGRHIFCRDKIQVPSVYGEKILDQKKGIAYLRIGRFNNTTATEFDFIVDAMTKNRQSPLNGLILDLRFNYGGVLKAAVELVNFFISEGVIVTTKGRGKHSNEAYKADPKLCKWPDLDLVVLINGRSASAAEVVAGALQDFKRAVIVGSPSLGKGAVQTATPMDIIGKPMVVKFPTALYYLPSGRCIDKKFGRKPGSLAGLTPDEAVRMSDKEKTDLEATLKQLSLFAETMDPEILAQVNPYADKQIKTALDLLAR